MKMPYSLNLATKLNSLWTRVTYVHLAMVVGLLILIRMSVFWYTQDVGLEVDGGLFLGVARNVALRGAYASYMNYSNDTTFGATTNIMRRFTVQDENGLSYFAACVTVGPGYVFPQALILKLFGHSIFTYKILPFCVTLVLLFCLMLLTGKLGGRGAALLLGMWFWARPDMYINQMFEPYGESLALLYLLGGLWAITRAFRSGKDKFYFLSGLLFGFAFLTKMVIMLMVGGFFIVFVIDVWTNGKERIRRWIVWGFSFLLPILAYEAYRYIYLVTNFGYSGYVAINNDMYLMLRFGGSGLSGSALAASILLKKIHIWEHLGMYAIPTWIVYALIPFTLLKNRLNRMLVISTWLATTVILGWYVFMSTSGWLRHVWYGVILAQVLIAAATVSSLCHIKQNKSKVHLVMAIVGIWLVLGSVLGPHVKYPILLTKEMFNNEWGKWKNRETPNGLQGPVFSPIFSWKDQQEALQYISSSISSDDYVYYDNIMTVTEISTISDRVFYPVYRYLRVQGNGYLIFGPYQKGFASHLTKETYKAKIENYCDKVVFENPSYTICHLHKLSED